ncbi:hypothetical protein ACVW19_002557 [Streptomyces sp. TE5632]
MVNISMMERNGMYKFIQVAVYALAFLVAILFFRENWLFVLPLIGAGLINFVLLPSFFRRQGGEADV